MPLGQVIELYLMDGTPSGRWQASLSNWNGVFYRFSRRDLAVTTDFPDLDAPGVYFLFGRDAETDQPFVYVGEGDYVRKRILQPHTFEKIGKEDECYWTEAIILVTPDQTLNKARIKYLEHRFYQMVTESSRYLVKNGNTPPLSPLPRKDQDLLEQVILNTEIMMPALGHRIFEKVHVSSAAAPEPQPDDDLLYFSRNQGKGGSATGKSAEDGFWVLKGSRICPDLAPYLPQGVRKLREKYASVIDAEGILQEDILFSSPSYAAAFVCGRNVNGPAEWKNRSGRSLKECSDGIRRPAPVPPPAAPEPQEQAGELLHLKSTGLTAQGRQTQKGFLVLAGSRFSATESKGCPEWVRRLRRQTVESGAVADLTFTADTLFNSSSAAASCICGSSRSGPASWTDRSGTALGDQAQTVPQPSVVPPPPVPDSPAEDTSPVPDKLHLVSPQIRASGRMLADGFLVLQGSQVREEETPSCPAGVREQRQARREDGTVLDGTLTRDLLFPSSSSAASFLLGRSASGRDEWCNTHGILLKALLARGPVDGLPPETGMPPDPEEEAPSAPAPDSVPTSEPLFLTGQKASGTGCLTEGGFLVLQGSTLSPEETASCPARLQLTRRTLQSDGTVQDGVFLRDVLFSSPSAAAGCLLGSSSNGLQVWKNRTGIPLKDLLAQEEPDQP